MDMQVELGTLSNGDVYANGKYRVLSNDGYTIKILRLKDKWFISFHVSQVNWKFKVRKD